MARSKIKVVQYRRKREGKTDYRNRLRLIKSGKPRLVVRRSLQGIWLQIVEYSPIGDKVVAAAHSNELRKLGWTQNNGNIPSAYLTGLLMGKKAAAKKIKEAVLDMGLYQSIKGNRIYAAVKGAIDGGLKVPSSAEMMPPESRLNGEHISKFTKKDDIAKQFKEARQKIAGK